MHEASGHTAPDRAAPDRAASDHDAAERVPAVSVVVCTRNGAARLREHLGSVAAAVAASARPAELIVVDNGSHDDTAAAATDAATAVRVVLAPIAGLARARNVGIAAARGTAVLFTDDDVDVPLDWVDRMAAPLLSGGADVVAGGIRVDDALRLPWVSPWVLELFADHPAPSASNAFVVGANFGALRSVFLELPFNEDLGAAPYQREEDAFFWIQAREAGLRIVGVQGTPVRHCFDADRLETPALIALAHTMGRCEAYVLHHWLHGPAPLLPLKQAVFSVDVALRRMARGAHPSDDELRHVARLSFVRELRSLKGRPRRFPSPAERAATR
ncbi:glycosyltransferase family 2 protein [Gryllotalpicola reticulitermitis]|uniref:Glycosyltransferase family 2 protein n=1 Tax=Gryllotalpicola reticulitermitis TaxID=1184153 RepID=A0ABV8Q8A0_9MICO